MKNHSLEARAVVQWLRSAESPKWLLVFSAVTSIGAFCMFFGVLEDVVTSDSLVEVDVFVFYLVQSLRAPEFERLMVIITELGDIQVLLPVTLVALLWFIAKRAWLTAGYWLAATIVPEVLVVVMKPTLHRLRPLPFYSGIDQFSFPSGHATMSVVVYGFLWFLAYRQMYPGWRRIALFLTLILIASIALSRVYLGIHWLSDVLGGLSLGVAWVATLVIAYEYQIQEQLRTGDLAAIITVTFLIAGFAHLGSSLNADLLLYAPQPYAP